MTREIRFRGQNIKGQWHYGLLSHNKDIDSDYEWFISNAAGKPFAFGAIEKSIGQFTGLHDKNGKEIYEGDIVKWGMYKGSEERYHRYAVVEINPDIQFRIIFYVNSENNEKKASDAYIFRFGHFAYKETDKHLEVIGNIFDNPELVKN